MKDNRIKKILAAIIVIVLAALGVNTNNISSLLQGGNQPTTVAETETYAHNSYQYVVEYIKENGCLPDNYITKDEAKKLGWESNKGNLAEVAPGKSIGGDVFGNREKLLPTAKGRVYYEADINYESGYRNDERLIFSNDGLFFVTFDHYESFEQVY